MKRRVAVLMGGTSVEHEVSLKSGGMVCGALNRSMYHVTPVVITQQGLWQFPEKPDLRILEALPYLKDSHVDCVFIALHGPFGEDGRLQGLLDLLELPYIGSGCAASALAMDKIRCKAVVQRAGVSVAEQVVISRAAWQNGRAEILQRVGNELGFPCVLKSPCQGSSLGMSIPESDTRFTEDLPKLLEMDDEVLVERYLRGVEVTCGVLDVEPGVGPRALPVTEIVPVTASFFDYHAKYTPGATEEITPARISERATRRVQEVAARVHEAVGCRGLSRSDMILRDEEPVWIEVNTIPGMTETSLFPQAAAAVGISFSELVGLLVESAITWRP